MLYSWQNIKRRIEHIEKPIGAEIGVYQGLLSKRLLENIPDLLLFMIDPWSPNTYKHDERLHKKFDLQCKKNYELARGVMHKFKPRASIIKKTSIEAADTIFPDNYFDFVFIDADHRYDFVKADIQAWLPKVKKGGWICGHDYPNAPGVIQAVDEIFPNAEIDSDFTWFVRVK